MTCVMHRDDELHATELCHSSIVLGFRYKYVLFTIKLVLIKVL